MIVLPSVRMYVRTYATCIDLPQVDLFLNFDLSRVMSVIFKQQSREGERERHKLREVDLFHLHECESECKFLARKT